MRRRTDKTVAKRTNNDLQNITHKTNDRVTRTPLKSGVNSGASESYAVLYQLLELSRLIIIYGENPFHRDSKTINYDHHSK